MICALEHVAERLRISPGGQEVALTDAMIRELVTLASRIAWDEDVLAFFWYCHHRIFHDPTLTLSWKEQSPPLDEALGQEAGLLTMLVMLSAVPEMQETCCRLGIPADIVRDTVADLRLWMETDLYYQRYQPWGHHALDRPPDVSSLAGKTPSTKTTAILHGHFRRSLARLPPARGTGTARAFPAIKLILNS